MGSKINDTENYASVTPATTDRVLGIDVSDTTDDANGAVKTFTTQAVADLYSVSEADVTAHEAALTITESQISDLGSYLTSFDVVDDTTPQLGGNLDVNGNKIVSTANGNIDIEPNGTGDVLLGNFTFDADQTVGAGQDDYVLTYDNTSGKISLEAAGGGGGLVPISKTTASTSAAVDIELTGGYMMYRLVVDKWDTDTDAAIPYIRISDDGGSTFISTSTYDLYQSAIGSSADGSQLTQTEINFSRSGFRVGTAASEHLNLDILIAPSNGTTENVMFGTYFGESYTAVYTQGQFHCGNNTSNTRMTHIRFYQSSGNILTGDFHLYGIADGA